MLWLLNKSLLGIAISSGQYRQAVPPGSAARQCRQAVPPGSTPHLPVVALEVQVHALAEPGLAQHLLVQANHLRTCKQTGVPGSGGGASAAASSAFMCVCVGARSGKHHSCPPRSPPYSHPSPTAPLHPPFSYTASVHVRLLPTQPAPPAHCTASPTLLVDGECVEVVHLDVRLGADGVGHWACRQAGGQAGGQAAEHAGRAAGAGQQTSHQVLKP